MGGDKILGIALVGVVGGLGLWALVRPKAAPSPPPPAPEMVLMEYRGFSVPGQPYGTRAWIFPQDVPAFLAGGWVIV